MLPRPLRLVSHLLLLLPLLTAAPGTLRAQGLPPVPVPPGNPISAAKADLGKVLFWDEQLSSTRTMACASCHLPASGGSDPLSRAPGPLSLHPGADGLFGTADDVRGSPGVVKNEATGLFLKEEPFPLVRQVTGRKAPSMINAAYSPALFWDGRAGGAFDDPLTGTLLLPFNAALESQAAGPPISDVEMAHGGRDWNDVASRIETVEPLALASDIPAALVGFIAGRGYPALFQSAFGSPDVTPARICMAIATYERTLISDQTPFDAFVAGNNQALSQQQRRGLQTFNGPGRCVLCHGGPLFTNQQFVNIGVRPPAEDLGLGGITGQPQDRGRFKVPGLRNVGLRGPYFHNGSQQTLGDVVAFYNRGGDFAQNRDPRIRPLGLSPQQQADLVAFLTVGLTDPRVAAESAPFDRPTLYAETDRVPSGFGAGFPGSGDITPRWLALEPPLVGNPSLTLAIADGLGGATPLLLLDILPAPPGTTLRGMPFHLGGTAALSISALAALFDVGPGEGWRSFSNAIPDSPALAGQTVYLQALLLDAGSPSGLSATPGLALEFFAD